jgi:hypothetical protein
LFLKLHHSNRRTPPAGTRAAHASDLPKPEKGVQGDHNPLHAASHLGRAVAFFLPANARAVLPDAGLICEKNNSSGFSKLRAFGGTPRTQDGTFPSESAGISGQKDLDSTYTST